MKKTYFIIKLNNAIYNIQRVSGKTGLKSVFKCRPCCIAENGFVLGVNDACENYDIFINEPLKEALVKCADLYVEAPRYVILKKASAAFLEICSQFGIAKLTSFDECLLEVNDLLETEIHSFISAVRETISDKLKVDSDIQLYSDYNQNLNPYSAGVSWCDYALELIAEQLSFKLCVDNACAKMFSVQVVDADGITHTIDRRVDIACNEYNMILFIIKSMIDITKKINRITVNLYDIYLNQPELADEKQKKKKSKNAFKKPSRNYTRQNRFFSNIINENKLFIYDNLCKFVVENHLKLEFFDLCAIVEKANTRRLKLGSYYLSADYAEKFVSLCEAQKSNHIKVLINGYIPLMLLYHIKEACRADFYYTNLDSRTLKIIELLDRRSPYPLLDLKPADSIDYDFILSGTPDVQYKSKYKVFIVRKSFFASAEKDAVAKNKIVQIFDFGEHGINGTYDQFVAILTDESQSPDTTEVLDLEDNYSVIQNQKYITDDKLPCWVLYRNDKFDSIYSKMEFNIFNVCTSNQIKQRDYNPRGDIRVISSACIDSERNVNVDEKCKFAQSKDIDKYDVFEYANRDDVFFAAANGTALKIARKPKGCVPNPSTVLLVPKGDVAITEKDIEFLSSPEFKSFYDVALNHQCFTLSSGSISQYFLGKTVASA